MPKEKEKAPKGPITKFSHDYTPGDRINPQTILESETYENFTVEELARRLFKIEATLASLDPEMDALRNENHKNKRENRRIKKKLGMPADE